MQEILKIIKIMKLLKSLNGDFIIKYWILVYMNDKTTYSWVPFIVISHCGPSKLHDETVFTCDVCSEENRRYRVIKIENFFLLAEMSNLTHINLNILILNFNKTLDLWVYDHVTWKSINAHLLSRSTHCTQFGNFEAKWSKDIEQTKVWSTDGPTDQ